MKKRFLSLILAILMAIGTPVAVLASEAAPVEPIEIVQEEQLPEEIIPEEPVEEAAAPEEVVPEDPVEEAAAPEEVVPEESVEEEPAPEEVVPEETLTEQVEQPVEEEIIEEPVLEEEIFEGEWEEVIIPEDIDLPDNDQLLDNYVQKLLDESVGKYELQGELAGSKLTGLTRYFYDCLKSGIIQVANGELESTEFVNTEGLEEMNWTAQDLGVPSIVVDGALSSAARDAAFERIGTLVNSSAIMRSLLGDCPADLYWFDKTTGMQFSPSIKANSSAIWVSSITFRFAVSSEYRADGAYTVDSSDINYAKTAIAVAKSIVEENAGKTDWEKLVAFKNKICELVDYNHSAADNNSTPYGNPWQLIYVFDGNTSTKVVCEGYSKAFKYLCDLSTFSNNIVCYCVSGTMSGGTGAGAHMWNLVNVNGINYLVDVTNCDAGTIGAPDRLFMTFDTCDVSNDNRTHVFPLSSDITYTYDTDVKFLFDGVYPELGGENVDFPGGDSGNDQPEEKLLNRLEIKTLPNKTTYLQGETDALDLTGLTAIVVYQDGHEADVTNEWSINGFDPNKVGVQTITVSYTEGGETVSATFTVTVNEVPKATALNIFAGEEKVTGKTLPVAVNGEATLTLSAVPTPAEVATNIEWSTSAAGVATVDANGVVTAVGKGTATITAKDTISGKSANVKISAAYYVTEIEITGPEEMAEGKSVKLVANVGPDAAANKKVIWSTSNPNYATVSSGTVKAKKVGQIVDVVITATAADGSEVYDTHTIRIFPVVTRVDILKGEEVLTSKSVLGIDLASPGATIDLDARTYPADAADGIEWKSSSPKVATVDPVTGEVTGHTKGSVTITATAIDGSKKSAKVKINVAYLAKEVTISGPAEMAEGKSIKLTAEVGPANTTNKKVTWTSSNPAYATVSNGTVKAKTVGQIVDVVITATAADGSEVYGTHTITIFPVVTRVDILKGDQVLDKKDVLGIDLASNDKTIDLNAQTWPADAADGIEWKSSSPKVATVDENGVVTGLTKGSVTITATATDGSKKSATVKINVANLSKGVTISGPAEMAAGKSVKLTATVEPANATNKKVTWTSSNTSYATVSNGTVKANKKLNQIVDVVITATAADGSGFQDTHTIKINPVVTKVDILDELGTTLTSKSVLAIDLASNDKTIDLGAKTWPEDAGDGVTWKSSSPKVATVDENGVVTGLTKGSVTITATATDGSKKSAKVKINVAYLAKSIAVNGPDEVAAGKSIKLTAEVGPANTTNKKVTWTSNNTNIATVSNGTVKAKAAGVVTITAKTADGSNITDTHTITVKPAVTMVEITEAGISFGKGTKITRPLTDGGISLDATTYPDAAGKGIEWKSSSNKIATVDQTGEVTFVKKGTVTITATATDGTKKNTNIKIIIE